MFTQNDIDNLNYLAMDIRNKFVPQQGLCLYMSSLFATCVNKNSVMNAKVAVGGLKINGTVIFKTSQIKDKIDPRVSFVLTDWDGHSWVEIDNLICDVSSFITIESSTTKKELKNIFREYFGDKKYLIDQKDNLSKYDIIYEKSEILEAEQVEILLQNALNQGFIKS